MPKTSTVAYWLWGALFVVTIVVSFISAAKPPEVAILNAINDQLKDAVDHMNPFGFVGSVTAYVSYGGPPPAPGQLLPPPPANDNGFTVFFYAVGYAVQKAADQGWVSLLLTIISLVVGALIACNMDIRHPYGFILATVLAGGLFLWVVQLSGYLLILVFGGAQTIASIPFAATGLTAANFLLAKWLNPVVKAAKTQAASSSSPKDAKGPAEVASNPPPPHQ